MQRTIEFAFNKTQRAAIQQLTPVRTADDPINKDLFRAWFAIDTSDPTSLTFITQLMRLCDYTNPEHAAQIFYQSLIGGK